MNKNIVIFALLLISSAALVQAVPTTCPQAGEVIQAANSSPEDLKFYREACSLYLTSDGTLIYIPTGKSNKAFIRVEPRED